MSTGVHTLPAGGDLYNEYLYAVKAEKWQRNDYAGWLENELGKAREELDKIKREINRFRLQSPFPNADKSDKL